MSSLGHHREIGTVEPIDMVSSGVGPILLGYFVRTGDIIAARSIVVGT